MQNTSDTRWLAAILISFLFVAGASAASGSKGPLNGLTPDDENSIKATIEAYRIAWLANDPKGVLKTFTEDTVLLPDHGAPVVVGIAAIEKYCFTPGGPQTTTTELNITVDQVSGSWTIAFARGFG